LIERKFDGKNLMHC